MCVLNINKQLYNVLRTLRCDTSTMSREQIWRQNITSTVDLTPFSNFAMFTQHVCIEFCKGI